jgi:hypothetical protein
MLLVPGPLPPMTGAWYDPTPEDPGFGAMVNVDEITLNSMEQQLDVWLDPNAIILDTLPDDGTNALLDTVGTVVLQLNNWNEAANVAQIDSYKAYGDNALIGVYEAIPGEAWAPVPPPQQYTGGPIQTPTAAPGQFSLSNLTRPGAPDYFEGEQFKISVHVPASVGGASSVANVLIEIYPWTGEGPRNHFALGSTDGNGNLSWISIWEPMDVDSWGATFYQTAPGGFQIAEQTLYWSVYPATPRYVLPPGDTGTISGLDPNAPGHSQQPVQALPLTVTLTNNANPGSILFHVGDTWLLRVTGPPNSAIVIGGSYNGNSLSPAQIGLTDASGVYTQSGAMSNSELGAWVETYIIGGQNWPGSLSFIVQP